MIRPQTVAYMGTNAWYLHTFPSPQKTWNIKLSTVIISCNIYLSGKVCRGYEWACWWTPCTASCHTEPRGLPRPRWAARRGGEGASPARSAAESSPPEVQVWYLVIHLWYKWSSPYTHIMKLPKMAAFKLAMVWHVRVWKVLSNIYRTAPHTQPLHTAVQGAVQSIQTFMSAIDHSIGWRLIRTLQHKLNPHILLPEQFDRGLRCQSYIVEKMHFLHTYAVSIPFLLLLCIRCLWEKSCNAHTQSSC